jgi:hypothetical protein
MNGPYHEPGGASEAERGEELGGKGKPEPEVALVAGEALA